MKKSIKILGINSSGFNTSASLIIDGKVLFAVEEEKINGGGGDMLLLLFS